MMSYRRRLYKFAGKINDDEGYNDDNDDIVVPEYRNISDTTYETMRPFIQHQKAANYFSSKTIETEKDRGYAYKQPVVNGFVGVRPTSAREEAKVIDDSYARYIASLPLYMRTDKPGLDRPLLDLFTILSLKGLEKPLWKAVEKGFTKLSTTKTAQKSFTKLATIPRYMSKQAINHSPNLAANTGKGAEKSVTNKIGAAEINQLRKKGNEYNYNIAEYPIITNPVDRVANPTSLLYSNPRNRFQVDANLLTDKGLKIQKGKVVPNSLRQKTDDDINVLMKKLDEEYERILAWNKSPHRKWGNESDRLKYISNLENTKRNSTVNITNLSRIKEDGYYNPPTHNIFLNHTGTDRMLNAYYHELSHAGDIFTGKTVPLKSKLLTNVFDNYTESVPKFLSKGAQRYASTANTGTIKISLRGEIDELMKNNYANYKAGKLLSNGVMKDINELDTYVLTKPEIVARVEELRQDLLTKAIKLNGRRFTPRTVIRHKDFAVLDNPKSPFGYINNDGVEKSILKKHDLDMFTPKTLMDLMNKLPFAVGIGTAGLAEYGLSKK